MLPRERKRKMDINKNKVETIKKSAEEREQEDTEAMCPAAKLLICGKETNKEMAENLRLETLSQTYSHRLKNQIIYKGLMLNQTTMPAGIDSLKDFEMKDGDVIVCGYPKSGTTWLQEVVYLTLTNGDIASARSKPCYVRCPLLEDHRAQTKSIPQMSAPRLMKSHMPYDRLPLSVHNNDVKMIYIIRNPKDVAVSYYYFYQSLSELGSYTGTWAEFLAMYLDGYVMYMDWFTNVKTWWAQKYNKKILLLTYEEMKFNAVGAINKIATFLGKDLDEFTVKRIQENTTFNVMKSNPSTNFAALKSVFKLPFMRKGEVGDWKNHFTVAQNELFDTIFSQRLTDPLFANALIFE